MRLYVGNLDFAATPHDLARLFGEFGPVAGVSVAGDPNTGRPRGFGFVEMGAGGAAARAALDGRLFRGRTLNVIEYLPPPAPGAAGRGDDTLY